MSEGLKIELPSQGWQQLLTSRQEILDGYDRAKKRSKGHEVESDHGRVAEAEVRKWLSGFLPKKFGVTAGYIVSSGLRHDQKMPHFDVIIYDAQNSPVLWIESDPDRSEQGRSMAIPVEHVQCVLEVKSNFSPRTVFEAIEHLEDLQPLMSGVDEPNARYKLHLPHSFVCGLIFIELRQKYQFSELALKRVFKAITLRKYIGSIILRGDGHQYPFSAIVSLLRSDNPVESNIGKRKLSLLNDIVLSASVKVSDGIHLSSALIWREANFAAFGFDLIAHMQGTYESGRLSSFYGLGSTRPLTVTNLT